MAEIPNWLAQAWALAKSLGAADLHAVSGERLRFRLHGELRCIDDLPFCPPTPWPEVLPLFGSFCGALTSAESSLTHSELGRARASLAAHQGGWMLVMRLIAEHIPSIADVQLSRQHADLALANHGLLLVTGATGSGKSSTLAAWLGHWREQRRGHVISLEDPIEFVHSNSPALGLVNQREIGRDCASFADGLRAVMAQQLIWSAETTDQLASAKASAPRAHACREVLVATPAVRHLIREHRLGDIEHIMQTHASLGMQTMAQAMAALPTKAALSR